MIELVIVVGFIIIWFLSKEIEKRKSNVKFNSLNSIIIEKNRLVDKLEKKLQNSELILNKVSNELRTSKNSLIQKNDLVREQQIKLEKKQHLNINSYKSGEYIKKIENLELILSKVEEHIDVLKKSIETLTESNKEKDKIIILKEEKIIEIESELKLYNATNKDDEFVISKDQFLMIEEQLDRYQKEIKELKNR